MSTTSTRKRIVKVAVYQQPLTSARMEDGATAGATIGENVYNADGTLFNPSSVIINQTNISEGGSSSTTTATITRVVQQITANQLAGSAALTDYVYEAVGAGGWTLTLPPAAGNTNRYTLKNGSAANCSVASTSGENFDGTASPITVIPFQSLDFVSDGTNWRIL